MSISVEIKIPQSKACSLKDLIPEGLEYGIYGENYVLREPNGSEDSVIMFDPKHIARGICIEVSDGKVLLDVSNVTSKSEIELFYGLVNYVCKKLGAKSFLRDEENVDLGAIDEIAKSDIESIEANLFMLTKKAETDGFVTIFGALNPIDLSAEDLRKIGADAERFGVFLHEKQSAKAYYAAAQIYADPEQEDFAVGIYNVPAEVRVIMPASPAKPFYFEDDVKQWLVYLYISDEEYGYLNFSDFVSNVKNLGTYDTSHFFLELTESQARKLLEKFGLEL